MSTNIYSRTWVAVIILTLSIGIRESTFAQGSLTPPGAPAPTMKTLDQVEPRTAITNVPFTITQSGSYYLTKSFEQNFASAALTVRTNNVTIDLCGFTLRQTTNTGADGVLVSASGAPLTNVVVRNGILVGFVNGGGVSAFGTHNCVFEDLLTTKGFEGIQFQPGASAVVGNLVRNCRACDNAGTGVNFNISGTNNFANVIEHCEALNNAGAGFFISGTNNLIINCRASGNSPNYSVLGGNRFGLVVLPATSSVVGSSGGVGTGTTDPFANLSY